MKHGPKVDNDRIATEITRADLRGSCCTCQRDHVQCMANVPGGVICQGWIEDRRKVAEILGADNA